MVNGNPEPEVNAVINPRDVADVPSKFAARLKGKAVIIDGVAYNVRAVPSLLTQYINGRATQPGGAIDRGIIQMEYVRYGIRLQRMREIVILDHVYSAAYDDDLNNISPNTLTMLFVEIFALTHLSGDEGEKLDFTTASASDTSTQTDG